MKEITLRCGKICATDENYSRISVYFDYKQDNYHIQFPDNAERITVGKLFRELSDRILGIKR